ncbi:MAG TPA: hypothetical protein PLA97_16190 [Rubrivivax sp.]|nr:hypothetical protein [Rubrivivax sp.]
MQIRQRQRPAPGAPDAGKQPTEGRVGARRSMPILALIAMLTQVAGCGAEVAGGAAAVGGLQAEQARQAKAQQEQAVANFKAAQDAAAARAASAADAAGR